MTGRSRKVPTEAEVLKWFDTLSNWGRWGPDDELGTLNLITPAKRLEAVRLVRKGIAVSCARPIEKGVATDVPYLPLHFMMSTGETWVGEHSHEPTQMALDFMGLVFHGFTVPHLDCLCHFLWKGKMYNGRRADVVTVSSGASVCSAETVRDGIVTRGVLLDVARAKGKKWLEAGDAVFPEHLDEAGAEDKRDLLGLYMGVPLTERFDYNMALPDRILIFQKPIEAACASDDEVVEEVRITVLHEVAHHFGMGDAELERLGLD
ncbi:MAG: metallopeptidase family protein [Dehalococcoidia bacterium]|nr:metallopeptidase family protein [Dehalococcoidia bacterium]